MIRRHQYYFASAAVCIGVCLSLAIVMPKPAKDAPMLKDVDAIKSDRIPTAFPGFAMHDDLKVETHSRHSDQYGGEFEPTDHAGCADPHRDGNADIARAGGAVACGVYTRDGGP